MCLCVMATTIAELLTSSGVTSWLRWFSRESPHSAIATRADSEAREPGVAETPAEATVHPALDGSAAFKSISAIGLRQVLPVQTNKSCLDITQSVIQE